MGCVGCSCSTGKDSVGGCGSSGGCASGGCNRHNTYDWLTAIGIRDAQPFLVVEGTFKNGSRMEFFKNPPVTRTTTGDWVVVESGSGGFDIGKISLSGDLVRLQMKRKRVKSEAKLQTLVRKAHERDLERLDELRQKEKEVMIRARAIARTLDLNMKVGDVEFQGDGRKCTFYYTADGRVDFRELIRSYAREFKVKIEMRQIGARQESARIGGIGNCGRELCCSTWLSEFKSVNTSAARYQNLAINQTKLSGMCGRLKCCLNYELDTYIEALEDFPDKAEKFKTEAGLAILVKTDVFKRLMFYTYIDNRAKFYAIHVDQIWEALEMIKNGKLPASLEDILAMAPAPEVDEADEAEPDYDSINDVVQLPIEKRKKKKKKKPGNRDRSQSAAAAVEKSAREEESGFRGRPQGRDQRGGQRPGGGQRPAQQGQQGQNRSAGNNQQRPPSPKGPRPEQPQTPRPEGEKPRQQGPRPEQPQRPPQQQGGNNNQNKGQQRPPQQNPNQPKGPQQPPKPPQQGGGSEQKNMANNNKNRDKWRQKNKPPRDENNNNDKA